MNLYKKMVEKTKYRYPDIPFSDSETIVISHYEQETELLGMFKRSVIWVYGCCFDCQGCLADNTKNGAYTVEDIESLARKITENQNTEGITISGGEPFLQPKSLKLLIDKIKKSRDTGVIIYSGFTLEELREDKDCLELLSVTDILIDGRYVSSLDDGRAYVGSSNQRINYLSDRYKQVGSTYYSAEKRRAEIKFTKNQAVLIGVPSSRVLDVWKKIKEKSGGILSDF